MFKLSLKALGLLVFLTPVAQAQMSDAQMGQAMRTDIAKYMATITAPKMIFHWVDASDINPPGQYNTQYPATAPHYREYVQKQGRRIYNRRSVSDADIAGPGLYMAADPLVSRGYGGDRRFGLIVGVMRAGARVLVGGGVELLMARAITSEVSRRGCRAVDYASLLDTTEAECTKVKQILVGTDVSFAEGRIYQWASQPVHGCQHRDFLRDIRYPVGTRGGMQDTFVVYNPNLFTAVYGYTHRSAPIGHAMADSILSYMKSYDMSGAFVKPLSSDEQRSNSAIRTLTPRQIEAFSQQHIFGCTRPGEPVG